MRSVPGEQMTAATRRGATSFSTPNHLPPISGSTVPPSKKPRIPTAETGGYVTSVCFGEPLCEPLHTAAPTTALLFSLRGASRAILDLKGCVNASCSYLKEKAM